MVDTITDKGEDLEVLGDQVTDFVSSSDGKLEETDNLKDKLKLVQEEYTIILKAVRRFF